MCKKNIPSNTKQVLTRSQAWWLFEQTKHILRAFTHVTDDWRDLAQDDMCPFKMDKLTERDWLIFALPCQHILYSTHGSCLLSSEPTVMNGQLGGKFNHYFVPFWLIMIFFFTCGSCTPPEWISDKTITKLNKQRKNKHKNKASLSDKYQELLEMQRIYVQGTHRNTLYKSIF